MATATTKGRTRKSSTKPAAKTAAKRIVRKPAAKPAALKREQDSVTGTFKRGKRDKAGVIQAHEPKAGGGVRFEDMAGEKSPVYLTQSDDAALGKPAKIRVTVKALA